MQVLARKDNSQFYTDISNAEALKALGYAIYAQIDYELSDNEIKQCMENGIVPEVDAAAVYSNTVGSAEASTQTIECEAMKLPSIVEKVEE